MGKEIEMGMVYIDILDFSLYIEMRSRNSMLLELKTLTKHVVDLNVVEEANIPEWYADVDVSNIERIQCPRLHCTAQVEKDNLESHLTNHCSEILPYLFLGGERNAKNLKELQEHNIKKIV